VAANPLYSALELAPDIGSDGRLEVQEIFQLNLKPAYLVTLSACETHVSEITPGRLCRLPGVYHVRKSCISRLLIASARDSIRCFIVECGIVDHSGVDYVVYRNGKGAGGLGFRRYKGHGSIGPGNAGCTAAHYAAPGDVDRGIGNRAAA